LTFAFLFLFTTNIFTQSQTKKHERDNEADYISATFSFAYRHTIHAQSTHFLLPSQPYYLPNEREWKYIRGDGSNVGSYDVLEHESIYCILPFIYKIRFASSPGWPDMYMYIPDTAKESIIRYFANLIEKPAMSIQLKTMVPGFKKP